MLSSYMIFLVTSVDSIERRYNKSLWHDRDAERINPIDFLLWLLPLAESVRHISTECMQLERHEIAQ